MAHGGEAPKEAPQIAGLVKTAILWDDNFRESTSLYFEALYSRQYSHCQVAKFK